MIYKYVNYHLTLSCYPDTLPPYGTNQRKYMGVLGTHRLEMGDGYGIHGTDAPESIGKSASHGCVRMLNADIDKLYDMVGVGTAVYIY